jgi:signal transduction histidine kinase
METQYSSRLKRLRHDLHDLCQPLMVLSLRLELEILEAEDERHSKVMQEMQMEAERIRQIVLQMRETLRDGERNLIGPGKGGNKLFSTSE